MEIVIAVMLLAFFAGGFSLGAYMKDHDWKERIYNTRREPRQETKSKNTKRHFQVIKEQLN